MTLAGSHVEMWNIFIFVMDRVNGGGPILEICLGFFLSLRHGWELIFPHSFLIISFFFFFFFFFHICLLLTFFPLNPCTDYSFLFLYSHFLHFCFFVLFYSASTLAESFPHLYILRLSFSVFLLNCEKMQKIFGEIQEPKQGRKTKES